MSSVAAIPYAAYSVRQDLKPKDLDGLSEKMIDQHWKLYEGYVTNTNLLNKLIWDVAESGNSLNNAAHSEVQRRLGFEYNGMVLHETYFGSLKSAGARKPSALLAARLQEDFGGFERWKKQTIEIGKMRGVGWVVLNYDPLLKRLNNFWITDHEVGNVAGFLPVAAMDVWEHAYALDYGTSAAAGTGRAAYIEAYFRNLDLDVISARLESAMAQPPIR